jgi:uncharacterized Fe-S cluster-containing radical SAM superfamily protein
MLDPLEITKQVEKVISKGLDKKYYRFRAAKFYGGIATADCVGCNLSCLFCWNWNYNKNPEKYGNFYSPKDVVEKLVEIAKKKNYHQCRISGGEPTINWQHLLKVLEYLSKVGLNLILETNGILIGYNEEYAKQLSDYRDSIHVRVSFKGATPEEFSKLTGSKPEFFELQIQALKNLNNANIPCHPAIMKSFSKPESIERLRDRLETINPSFYDIEEEALILYESIKKRLNNVKTENEKFKF